MIANGCLVAASLLLGSCEMEEGVHSAPVTSAPPADAVAAVSGPAPSTELGSPAGVQARKGQPIREQMGVQVQPWYLKHGDLARIEAAGFGVLRWGISWQVVERSPGSYDWSEIDAFVARLKQTRLRSVVILGFGNPHYSGEVNLSPDPAVRDALSPLPPETEIARAAYARFAAEAARRYADAAIDWEIWNEPDSPVFWPVTPNAASYARMADEACRAIKTAVPRARVVGVAGAALPNAVMRDPANHYAASVANNAAACFDAISGHGYRMQADYRSPAPESIAGDIGQSLQYLYNSLRFAKQKPFYVTEWGYPSSLVDADLQLAYVMRGTLTNVASNVPLTIWYEWRNSRLEQDNHEAHFGLNEMYGEAKATPETSARLAWLGEATFQRKVTTGRPDVEAVLVSHSGRSYLVSWIATDDAGRRLAMLVSGSKAGEIDRVPKAFPVAADNLTVSYTETP